MKEPPAEQSGNPIWPPTDWPGVRGAAASVGRDAETLQRLIVKYQIPLRIHLVSTFPALRERAGELLQDFAEDKILDLHAINLLTDWLRGDWYDPDR